MQRTRTAAILLAALALACAADAQIARREQAAIDGLLHAVETSGCAMERNGTRHDAKEAADHLRMKLDRAGARVQTAGEFIDRVASSSYTTGKPYLVLCPGRAPQPAGDWLRARLNSAQGPARP
jgi:hypothetical protein